MTNYKGWDWVVRSYQHGRLMLETTHRGEVSRDMEIEAARSCGREVQVFEVKDGTAWPWQRFDPLQYDGVDPRGEATLNTGTERCSSCHADPGEPHDDSWCEALGIDGDAS